MEGAEEAILAVVVAGDVAPVPAGLRVPFADRVRDLLGPVPLDEELRIHMRAEHSVRARVEIAGDLERLGSLRNVELHLAVIGVGGHVMLLCVIAL
ncbi:Uncharacterised protein [Mycobacteroides abscessus subsp. abscessus]|nr:Uncharacterised protein [Mycobacteroides abscessus subsp. abscessus]